jgi:tellurium resistance protein TerD
MAINLVKGQRIEIGLSKVGVGLGWDPNEGTGFDFDLDASAFMLGKNKEIPEQEFFVFYGYQKSPDGAVESSGDDLTGGNSDGDDETLTVDLNKIDPRIEEIIFTVTIHEYEKRKQNFGQVRNSFIRIYNAQTNEEIAKYELDEDFSIETAIEFGRLYKKNEEWKFEAMGIGYKGGLEYFCNKYAKKFM